MKTAVAEARIRELTGQIEDLQAQLAHLRELARPASIEPLIPGLRTTRYEAIVLALLLKRDLVTRAQLSYALHQDEERCDSAVPVIMVRVRRKLEKLKVHVRAEYNRGWYIPLEDRRRLNKLAADAKAEAESGGEVDPV